MNQPFMHLLWKSYRSQREIWITMLGGMLLLQFLMLASPTGFPNPFTACLLITLLIAIAFLCVSTLLMFVMEEEQGTALWLRLLPIKWWQQLAAGLLCSIGLTVTLVLTGLAIAWLNAKFYQAPVEYEFIRRTTTLSIWAALPVWIVGLTISALIRRVVVVIPIIVVIAVTTAVLASEIASISPIIAISIVAACVLPFAIQRWQLGRPWNWRNLASRRANADIATSGSTLKKSSLRTRLLRRAAMADGLQYRTTLVLYWQELLCAIPFAVVGLMIGIASVIYCRTSAYPAPLEPLWLLFFTMECGLRTFRHDQQKQHGLFWAHRGVSPIKVWLIKNSVWLPILILAAFAVAFLDGFDQAKSLDETSFGLSNLIARLADPFASEHQLGEPWLVNGSRTSPMHMLIAMVATGYFVAQLCSVWLRPPLVAGFIALIGFLGVLQWIFLCQSSDIPLTFSTWPIAAFCGLATVWTSRCWMDRRQDGWIWTKRIMVLCLLPLGLWLGHQYYRRGQISSGIAALDPGQNILQHQAMAYLNSVGEETRIENSVTDDLWRDLMQHGSEPVGIEQLDGSGNSDPTNLPARSNKIIHDLVSRKDWNNSYLPIELRTSWQASIAPVVGRQVTSEANKLVRIGKAGDAFDLLFKGVQLTEYLAAQTTDWAEIQNCMDVLRGLHQHLHWCASSNQVTAEELRLAVAQLQQQEHFAAVASMLRNRMGAFHQLWSPNSKLFRELNKTKKRTNHYGSQSWTKEYLALGPTDRFRHLTLLQSTTIATAIQLRNGFTGITEDLFQWNGQFQRWAETTPIFGFDSDPLTKRLFSNLRKGPIASIQGAIDSRRATWWILQMQVYRREFGQLPTEAELRFWLADQGLSDIAGQLRRQGSGVSTLSFSQSAAFSTLAFFRDTSVRLDASQPVIGDNENIFLESEIGYPINDPIDVPLNKDRVIFVEQSNDSPAAPPVSGELAELIQNSTLVSADSTTNDQAADDE